MTLIYTKMSEVRKSNFNIEVLPGVISKQRQFWDCSVDYELSMNNNKNQKPVEIRVADSVEVKF